MNWWEKIKIVGDLALVLTVLGIIWKLYKCGCLP